MAHATPTQLLVPGRHHVHAVPEPGSATCASETDTGDSVDAEVGMQGPTCSTHRLVACGQRAPGHACLCDPHERAAQLLAEVAVVAGLRAGACMHGWLVGPCGVHHHSDMQQAVLGCCCQDVRLRVGVVHSIALHTAYERWEHTEHSRSLLAPSRHPNIVQLAN